MATYYTIEEGHYSMGNTSTNICSYSQVQHIPGLEHDFVALRVCELWIKVQIRHAWTKSTKVSRMKSRG